MRNQRGAILVVALILLVLLGVMGTTSLRSAIFQEKVAAQMHDRSMAFESAEAGLAWCEAFYQDIEFAYLDGSDSVGSVTIGSQISDTTDTESTVAVARLENPSWYLIDDFWTTSAHEADIGITEGDVISRLAQNPRCVRERVTDTETAGKYFSAAYAGKDDVMADKSGGSAARSGGIYHFRTTAQGAGRGGDADSEDRALTTVVLQADYFKRLE